MYIRPTELSISSLNARSHIPVLLKEVLAGLDPHPGDIFIDGTVGEGGHSLEILKKIKPGGILIGIDWDESILQKAYGKLQNYSSDNRIILEAGNYAEMNFVAAGHGIKKVSGVLLDLGFGTHTLESSGRGFSFQKDEWPDMRYSPKLNQLTAYEIINSWPAGEIAKIIYEYGEDRNARRIAKTIVFSRKIKKISSTKELAGLIAKATGFRGKLHPATKTFQALRIAVNDELENLKKGLVAGYNILNTGGKIAVISFHSLEDRIIKNFFKEQKGLRVLTKKPIVGSQEELSENPRARSAKLRIAQKI